jgi:hypothetical protein
MNVITIGRGTENDIVVNDAKISRHHLQIVQDNNGNVSVVDLGSTNGVYVNGVRITGPTTLKSADIVRIGDTTLPWQSYFPPTPSITRTTPINDPPKPSRTLWWVAAAVVLVLFIGGGIGWKIYQDKKEEKAAIERAEKEKLAEIEELERKATEARISATEASEEAEKAARIAAQSRSAEDRKNAEEKQRIADEAKAEADRARSAQQAEKRARNEAEKKREEAENQSRLDNKAKNEASRAAAEAEKKRAEEADARIDAQKALELTQQFHKVFREIKSNKLKSLCEVLELKPDDKANLKDFIDQRFNEADNNRKQAFIDAANKIQGVQTLEEEEAKKARQDSTAKATVILPVSPKETPPANP